MTQKKINKLPYIYYTFPTIILAASGFAASCYLAVAHYRNYTDIGYSSFCALSKSVNCDTVAQSSWSLLFDLPVALWGVFAYLFFLILSISAQKKSSENHFIWDFLFCLALLFSIADIYFGYLSTVKIKAYCIVCLFTYAISFFLLFNTWIIRKRFNEHSLFHGIKGFIISLKKKIALTLFLISIIIIFLSTKLFLPHYWVFSYPQIPAEIQTGITAEGNPWLGSENPVLTIHEFADYQCFQCSKIHHMLRLLINEYPTKVRLVHHHFPMDEKYNTLLVKEKFHTGSGDLALLAISASKQDMFWQTNDALYSITEQEVSQFNIRKFAIKMGLDEAKLKQEMYSSDSLKILENDIRTGLKNQIIGTPSFIVNGKMYSSHLPPELFFSLSND